jgi:hypothetical protein
MIMFIPGITGVSSYSRYSTHLWFFGATVHVYSIGPAVGLKAKLLICAVHCFLLTKSTDTLYSSDETSK